MYLRKRAILIFSLIILFNANVLNCVTYKAKPLDILPILTEQKNTVSLSYKIFNKFDCKKYLGRDKVISRGYQPIQISITNNADTSLVLSLSNFSIPCLPFDEVAENLYFNTVNRVVGWTIGGLFLWPLFIPAIVEGISSPKANEKLFEDYRRKALNNQTIKPLSTVNGLIFVSADHGNRTKKPLGKGLFLYK